MMSEFFFGTTLDRVAEPDYFEAGRAPMGSMKKVLFWGVVKALWRVVKLSASPQRLLEEAGISKKPGECRFCDLQRNLINTQRHDFTEHRFAFCQTAGRPATMRRVQP
jgi:hypothetical protein